MFPTCGKQQWQALSQMGVSKIQFSIWPIVVLLSPLPSHNSLSVSDEFHSHLSRYNGRTGNDSGSATQQFSFSTAFALGHLFSLRERRAKRQSTISFFQLPVVSSLENARAEF